MEEATITGETQQDAAMSAFHDNDFETAEIAFLDNAKCALRKERHFIASLETQTNRQISDNIQQTNSNAPTGTTGINNTGNIQASSQANLSTQSNMAKQPPSNKNPEYTCDNRAFQLYMAGLSQIQLGKREEALINFKRATTLSKVLYDAHYKIGLISLLDKNIKEAKKQLKKIDHILKRCKRCESREEILQRQEHLKKSIANERA